MASAAPAASSRAAVVTGAASGMGRATARHFLTGGLDGGRGRPGHADFTEAAYRARPRRPARRDRPLGLQLVTGRYVTGETLVISGGSLIR